jgi:hypothetical protein
MLTVVELSSVLTAAKPILSPTPLRVLLVGAKEEDFFLVREILERNRKTLAADLDHAHTPERGQGYAAAKGLQLGALRA